MPTKFVVCRFSEYSGSSRVRRWQNVINRAKSCVLWFGRFNFLFRNAIQCKRKHTISYNFFAVKEKSYLSSSGGGTLSSAGIFQIQTYASTLNYSEIMLISASYYYKVSLHIL